VSVSVEVADQLGLGLAPGPVVDLVKAVLDLEEVTGSIVVALVDESTIEQLNSRFRGLPEPTDVLSFRYADDPNGWAGPSEADVGEIIVCLAVVRRYAIEEDVTEARQFGWTLVHGALHLAGYDHESDQGEMRARERDLLERFDGLVEALSSSSRG
jgi:probable rRNA maturation factor